MKLSSIIAKEIRIKHLKEGIKHAQTRSKYRSFKLKENYVKPQSEKNRFYLYSNIFGTEFIFKKEGFDICEFSNPSTAFNLVTNLMGEINQSIHSLWVQQRSLVKEEYFRNTKTILNFLMTIVIVFTLGTFLLYPASQQGQGVLREENVEWSMVGGLAIVIIMMVAVYFKMFLTKYTYFHFDTEVIKAISQILIKQQSNFQQIGIEIDCDAQLTWICFSTAKSSTQQQNQINQFKQYLRQNLSSQFQQERQEESSNIFIPQSD